MPLPTLLYDGQCGFCEYWVRYWRALTGDTVRYVPYQEIVDQIAVLTPAQCQAAVQLLASDGRIYSGADASFRVLAYGGCGALHYLYRRVTLFAYLSECAYRFVARRRGSAFLVATALWGAARHPPRYDIAASAFTRLMGLFYIVAFASFGIQARGLIGREGILPLEPYLEAVRAGLGAAAYHRLPSIFWLGAGDGVLLAACAAGVVCGFAVVAGRLVTPALAGAYLLYLSLVCAGQTFMAFQWDLLLLEAGFLSILLPTRCTLVPLLFRWLLFRFMFLSGCVKLLSGDPAWASLAALDFHYATQPLPTPLAWYLHQLPGWFHHLCVVVTLVVELVLPFLIFAPRRPRMLAAGGIVMLELVILATGNYSFFNLLTIGLCVFLFEDRQLAAWCDRCCARGARDPGDTPGIVARGVVAVLASLIIFQGSIYLIRPFAGTAALPAAVTAATRLLDPFRIANGYGLFAVMTTTRREIIVQGSRDGTEWVPYDFRFKPGEPTRAPRWNAPHQPRLDWQMWFAALTAADRVPWFDPFLARLLERSPPVMALLAADPFAGAPPRFVRALVYVYRFTDHATRSATGAWWTRELEGVYAPAVARRPAGTGP